MGRPNRKQRRDNARKSGKLLAHKELTFQELMDRNWREAEPYVKESWLVANAKQKPV